MTTAADVLGVSRLEFLGYTDSGMIGEPTNDDQSCFWQADVDEAATRLAAIVQDEGAGVLVIYDDHGGYGHPDHIQVHRVGIRAAELAGIAEVYEATIDRDRVAKMIRESPATEGGPDIDENSDFGVREWQITTRIDVSDQVATKRAAMRCHRSQIPDDAFFLAMPDEQFQMAFSEEQYIHRGAPTGAGESALQLA
jgi:LmbE family N-acetylglucosaminyl deacetylase